MVNPLCIWSRIQTKILFTTSSFNNFSLKYFSGFHNTYVEEIWTIIQIWGQYAVSARTRIKSFIVQMNQHPRWNSQTPSRCWIFGIPELAVLSNRNSIPWLTWKWNIFFLSSFYQSDMVELHRPSSLSRLDDLRSACVS